MTDRLVLCADGIDPELVAVAGNRLGLSVWRDRDGLAAVAGGALPVAGVPLLLLGAVEPERLGCALAPPFAGVVEASATGALCGAVRSLFAAGPDWGVVLTAATAYRLDAAAPVTTALAARFNMSGNLAEMVAAAVAEAIANAVLHGGLEIGSSYRRSLDGFHAGVTLLHHRLADPAFADRPVAVAAARQGRDLVVSVADSGPGYDAMAAARPSFPSAGRGLGIIRASATTIVVADGGRRITMTFSVPRI